MIENKKLEHIFQILRKLYPDPKTELDYSTPFQLMIVVILSAQTTDKQVNKVTKELFEHIKTPKDLLDWKWLHAPRWKLRDKSSPKLAIKASRWKLSQQVIYDAFEKAVSWVNYYKTKAKNIRKLAGILSTPKPPLRGLQIPTPKGPLPFDKGHKLLEELMKLPWIGIKSAKVIGHTLWNLPVIAVDTHVHRVVNRRWILHAEKPNETSEILEKLVPLKYKDFAHHAIVLFGRYVCTAKNPKCGTCKLKKYCDYYQSMT